MSHTETATPGQHTFDARAEAHGIIKSARLAWGCGGGQHSLFCERTTAALRRAHDVGAAGAQAKLEPAREAVVRLLAFRDAVTVIHAKVQENLTQQEESPHEVGLEGREMGLISAMSAVLRVACPEATDAEDAIETLAALEGLT